MTVKNIKSKKKVKKLTEKDLVGKRRAVTYQRFSSVAQKGNSSLDRQTEVVKAWLKRDENKDIIVVDSFVDEAMSGWTGKNKKVGSLRKLLDAIKEGFIPSGTLILVEHFSRLTRQNHNEAEDLLKEIWAAGITIVIVEANRVYPPESVNDLEKKFSLILEVEKAFKESDWRSKKVKASYAKREKEAREDNKTPKMRRAFWLRKDGKLNKHHVVIKDIFNWYEEGLGQQRIIVKLREKYPKVDAVTKMNPSTVMRWLQSEVVLGKWREIKVYDAAIDETLFYKVQGTHKDRLYKNVKPDRNWPLSGLMQCGVCGKGMSIQKSKNTLPVVRCSSKQRDKSCNRKTTFPYFIVHQYMFSTIQKVALRQYSKNSTSKEVQIDLVKTEHELTKLYNQLAEDKRTRQELKDKGKSTRMVTILMSETDEEIEVLENKLKSLKEAMAEYDNYMISDSARDLVLTPRNFNLEMHKLKFRIVVGEDRLTTTGLNEPTPTMIYRGYSRKTLSYKYSLGGIEFEFPTKWINESALMLEGVANESGELPKSYDEIINRNNLTVSDIDSLSPEDKLIRQKETVAMFKSLLEENNNS